MKKPLGNRKNASHFYEDIVAVGLRFVTTASSSAKSATKTQEHARCPLPEGEAEPERMERA